jgi:hypothetical protein
MLNPKQFKYVPDEEHVTLYRVLKARDISDVNHDVLGIHWTADRDFALEQADSWKKSVIITAKAQKSDIVDFHSPEGEGYSSAYSIYGPDSPEKERTLRPGTELKDVSMAEGNYSEFSTLKNTNRKLPYRFKYVGDSSTMRGPYKYDYMRHKLRLRPDDLS